jgi:signal transduction histidine kinase/ligand-binding sensor domain-containing protein
MMTGQRIVVLGLLLICCPDAFALDPSLDVNQYAHTAWNFREGFSKGRVTSLAQTPDGYLWLGTEFGLLRFDGIQSVPWRPPGNEQLPNSWIRTLLAAGDGTLWIGTLKGLASWKSGRLIQYPELAGQSVDTLLVDREGTVWAGGYKGPDPTGTLCAIQRGRATCYADESGLGQWVASLYEDRGGSLWAAAQTGLWRWRPGPPKLYPIVSAMVATSQSLIEAGPGTLLVATQDGIRALADGKGSTYQLPSPVPRFRPQRLMRDRDGGLWIGTLDRGLLHVHGGRTDAFTQANGLSGDFVTRLFEDREGNIWVATKNGLDRFRDLAVRTISTNEGLPSAPPWSVLAARDGSVWLGSLDGLSRWNGAQVTIYRPPGDSVGTLFEDGEGRLWVSTLQGVAYFKNGRFIPVSQLPGGRTSSIAGDGTGNLWIANDTHGLYRLRGGTVVEHIPWAAMRRGNPATTLLPDPLLGGLWLGFQGSVAYVKDGEIHASYTAADGLAEGRVNDLRFDGSGALWVAMESGLSHVNGGRVVTLSSRNGLPCDAVHWSMEDDDHSVWLHMVCGLVRIASTELNALVSDPTQRIQTTVFDSSDGVGPRALPALYHPQVAKTADGQLWFLPGDGVSVINPRHLSINTLPPSVHIEQVTADRKIYEAASDLRLPPLIRDLQIDYTALSFVAPEKVRFRYKLEARDRDWQDVGPRRQAFYTDLSPGPYRFRVMASNNSGVWNEAGASLDFSIAPAYYQNTWFRAASVVGALVLLWTLYQVRLRQLAHVFDVRLQERLSERSRIARDLHDTLLQSTQALILHVQAAVKGLSRSDPARQQIEHALDRADEVLAEGRARVQDLRAAADTQDLATAIAATAQGLATTQPSMFRVVVHGTARELHPIVLDEMLLIAREALFNAFHHADATTIEVEITYEPRDLRLRVADDGRGIDASVLEAGARSSHWGLPSMQERARKLGGKFHLRSRPGAGTEIDVVVSGVTAYRNRR